MTTIFELGKEIDKRREELSLLEKDTEICLKIMKH